jgi:hypothetical protein
MQTKFKLASHLVVAALALCSQFAYASNEDRSKSFEDGLSGHFKKDDDRKLESGHYSDWNEIEHASHVTMVPEPSTDVMLLSGVALFLVVARRRRESRAR